MPKEHPPDLFQGCWYMAFSCWAFGLSNDGWWSAAQILQPKSDQDHTRMAATTPAKQNHPTFSPSQSPSTALPGKAALKGSRQQACAVHWTLFRTGMQVDPSSLMNLILDGKKSTRSTMFDHV